MKKGDLKDLMSKRTPLAQREVVEPVSMYTTPQVEKTTTPQVGEETSGQMDKSTTLPSDKTTNKQVRKAAKPQVEKYTTHLRPDTIKAIKREALENDRKDYEVVQQALDEYLNR
jgi:hypothetical protein